jgi:hypothetical protein
MAALRQGLRDTREGRRLEIRRLSREDIAARLPDPIQEGVAEDGEQPGAAVGPRIEAMEAPKGPEASLLHEVFGLRPVMRQSQGELVEGIQMDQGDRLKLAAPVASRQPVQHRAPPIILTRCPVSLFPRTA